MCYKVAAHHFKSKWTTLISCCYCLHCTRATDKKPFILRVNLFQKVHKTPRPYILWRCIRTAQRWYYESWRCILNWQIGMNRSTAVAQNRECVKPQLHIPDSGYDSSRFVPMRPILTNRDASGWLKHKIQKSLRCLTTFLRYLYDSFTIHDGATTMLLRCYFGRVTT